MAVHLTTQYFVEAASRYKTMANDNDVLLRARKIMREFANAEYCAATIEFYMKELIRGAFTRANQLGHVAMIGDDLAYAQYSDPDLAKIINSRSAWDCYVNHMDNVWRHKLLISQFICENIVRSPCCICVRDEHCILLCAILDSLIKDCATCDWTMATVAASVAPFTTAGQRRMTDYVSTRIQTSSVFA